MSFECALCSATTMTFEIWRFGQPHQDILSRVSFVVSLNSRMTAWPMARSMRHAPHALRSGNVRGAHNNDADGAHQI